MNKPLIASLTIVVTFALFAFGQNSAPLLGEWKWEAPGGHEGITLSLKTQRGTALTGELTLIGDGRHQLGDHRYLSKVTFKIQNARLTGDVLTFEQVQGIPPFKIVYTGKPKGDTILFTRESRDYWGAIGPRKTEFEMRRVR